MAIQKKNLVLVGTTTLLFITISTISWLLIGQITLIFSLTLMLGILMTIQLKSYEGAQELLQKLKLILIRESEQNYKQYRQIESLFSIFSLLKISRPLPFLRKWAISPDFATVIMSLFYEKKPQLIVELGSGSSTLISAYCLQEIGSGKIISYAQGKDYAKITNPNIAKHGSQDFAEVIYTPMKEVKINNEKWLWYDEKVFKELQNIDILIVDGPVQTEQKQELMRYPALPILDEHLNNNSVVVLDDAGRNNEKRIAELWVKEFDGFKVENISTEKGTIILSKS